jgi:hypothetical protein
MNTAEQDPQNSGIFNGHPRTLAEIGEHWMSGISDENQSM